MPAVDKQTFAERLQRLMGHNQQTAYGLARDCGFATKTVRRLLDGKRQPTFLTVQKICRELGVGLEAFNGVQICE